jgi:hypothetical protein
MMIVLIVYLITPNKVEDIAVFVDSRSHETQTGHDEKLLGRLWRTLSSSSTYHQPRLTQLVQLDFDSVNNGCDCEQGVD